MAENITSVLLKPEATDLSLSDNLYLIQGSGRDRDKKVKLSTLLEFFKKVTDKITIKSAKYTIEIDSSEGTFSIYDPEGSAGISFGYSTTKKTPSFTSSVGFDANINLDGSLNALGTKGGVVINENGVSFEYQGGEKASTQISESEIETYNLNAEGKVKSKEFECDGISATSSIVQIEKPVQIKGKGTVTGDLYVAGGTELKGDVVVRGDLTVQGGCGFGSITANRVDGVWATGFYSVASQLPTEGVQKGSFAFANNSRGVLKLYVYTGSGWTELNP